LNKNEKVETKFFGRISDWEPPQFVDSPSPQFNDVFDLFIERRDNALAAVTTMLSRLSDSDLKTIMRAAVHKISLKDTLLFN
jgi:hypothetical protein